MIVVAAVVVVAAIMVGVAAFVIVEIIRAPHGWQDGDGFHYEDPRDRER